MALVAQAWRPLATGEPATAGAPLLAEPGLIHEPQRQAFAGMLRPRLVEGDLQPPLYEAHRVKRNFLGSAGGMPDDIGIGLVASVRRSAAPPCLRSARRGCLTIVPRSWANARPGGRDPSL